MRENDVTEIWTSISRMFLKEKGQQKKTQLHNDYKNQRNLVVSMIRTSKVSYYQKYFQECKSNVRKTWDGVKFIINLNKKAKFLPTKVHDDANRMVTEPRHIATTFNKYFASVGQSLDAKIPESKRSYRDYMPSNRT